MEESHIDSECAVTVSSWELSRTVMARENLTTLVPKTLLPKGNENYLHLGFERPTRLHSIWRSPGGGRGRMGSSMFYIRDVWYSLCRPSD